MKKKIAASCCMLVATALMALPIGVAMTFAPGPTERITQYYSYFALMPIGYADWLPMIAALFQIAALILLTVSFKKPPVWRASRVCLSVSIGAAALSWIVFHTFSVAGVCIIVLQIAVIALLTPLRKRTRK